MKHAKLQTHSNFWNWIVIEFLTTYLYNKAMNKQIFQLLNKIILTQKTCLSADQVLRSFDVVPRTLYNYWQEIEYYLNHIDARGLISFDGKEFRFLGTDQDRKTILTTMNTMSFHDYKLSSQERQAMILIRLLTSNSEVRHQDFTDMLGVSRNTITNDMREIKVFFHNYSINYNECRQRYSLDTLDEYTRRKILLDILDEYQIIEQYFIHSSCDPCVAYIIKYLQFDIYRDVIEDAIHESESKFSLNLSDRDYFHVITILLVSLLRNNANQHLVTINGDIAIPAYDPSLQFAQNVLSLLENQIRNDDFEINFFLEMLHRFNIVFKTSYNTYEDSLFALITHEVLDTMSDYYHTNLLQDTILMEYLKSHLVSCYYRLKKGHLLHNPYLEEIRTTYPKDFHALKEHVFILENALNISFNDDEIAYILMHLLASVERKKNNEKLLKAIIVCHTGLATGNFLATQIIRFFRLNIVATCSVHNAQKLLEENHADLIISTIPIQHISVPTVVVNALLTEQDIHALHRALSKLGETSQQGNYTAQEIRSFSVFKDTFLNLFSKDNIVFDKEVLNWQEAIMAAGELLLWKKAITVNYLQQMINLVITYGPYIVITPGIALAHAKSEDGALENEVSIIRLKQPVHFGKTEFDPVQVVLACSIKDTEENTNALLQLMRIIMKPQFLSMIQQASDPQEILDYFAKFT